ncbi:E3 SUMO-protein ligase NSE2-like [Sitophilus oryzae]|uniref:E3 SUMO-protein ligase NSE2 n=1 Tax=Sitophilus oryzae TaxID=7048 RepID=A0A6J2XIH4_SITOR|nr:E3 SUMO-protein ligase NSE2-like [Sitophilus oryzae]
MALKERYSVALNKCLRSLSSWKNVISDNLDTSTKQVEMQKFQDLLKEYCLIDNDFKKSEQAISLVEDKLGKIENLEDIDKVFQEKLSEQPDEEVTSSEIWQEYFLEDLSVQELKQKKKKDKAVYEEVGDDSVLCSSSFTPPIDPISKTVIRNPVKNKNCKHIYESDSIYQYMRQSKRKARCPYVGCKNNKLDGSDLTEDKELEEKISQYIAQSQDSSDGDSSDDD